MWAVDISTQPYLWSKYEYAFTAVGLNRTGIARWRKWKRAFEYYAKGKGIENVRKFKISVGGFLIKTWTIWAQRGTWISATWPNPLMECVDCLYSCFCTLLRLRGLYFLNAWYVTNGPGSVKLQLWCQLLWVASLAFPWWARIHYVSVTPKTQASSIQ